MFEYYMFFEKVNYIKWKKGPKTRVHLRMNKKKTRKSNKVNKIQISNIHPSKDMNIIIPWITNVKNWLMDMLGEVGIALTNYILELPRDYFWSRKSRHCIRQIRFKMKGRCSKPTRGSPNAEFSPIAKISVWIADSAWTCLAN